MPAEPSPAVPHPEVDAAIARQRMLALVAAGLDAQRPRPPRGPQKEPDRTVWRFLSVARLFEEVLTDEQIRAAYPVLPIEQIAAARARVAGDVEPAEVQRVCTPPDETIGAPQLSFREMIACGLATQEAIAGIVEETMLYPNNDFVPDDLTAEEREDLDRAFAEADAEHERGETIPREHVLTRHMRRAP